MENVNGNYAFLITKIDEFIRKYYLNKVVRGALYLSAALLFSFLTLTVFEYYLSFSTLVRTILFYSFIAGHISILVLFIVKPLMAIYHLGETLSHEKASAIIGEHFKPVKDKLLNTLQLRKLADENPSHRLLIEASINQKISELKPIPFSSAIRITDNKRYVKFALVPLGLIVIIFFSAPSIFSESTERLLNYNKRYIKKAPFKFIILNKDLNAVQGSDFELEVKLIGNEIPNELYLEDGSNTYKLSKTSTVRFSYLFKNLQQSKRIWLTSGEFSSEIYDLQVKLKPSLINFDIHLSYPAYLNKKNESLNNSGDISVPAGTRITWNMTARNTSYINFIINSSVASLKPTAEGGFTYTHRALASSSYSIRPVNPQVNSADSMLYNINVIPDLYPGIEVIEKPDSLNNKIHYFMGQVSDDHGFSKLNFHYRIFSEGSEKATRAGTIAIPLSLNSIQSNFFYGWDIKEAKAQPGQKIEYFFEIYDNDAVSGPKSRRSALKTLKLDSQAEAEKKMDESSESIKQKMEQAITQARKLELSAKKISQDLQNKKTLTYDDKKQLEQLLQNQKNLEELVKDIQDENKKNLTEQQESGFKQDILEKQKQIEDLFNNVLDEKTREILKNIQKLLEQNNKNMTQDELSKMQLDNKSLQKELDRILELYKQLEFDQKLDQAVQKLKDLAAEQQKLSDKSNQKNADLKPLSQEQEELKKDFNDIKKDLSELQKKNEELEQKSDYKNPEKEQEMIDQSQDQSSKNLQNKDSKKASENQRKAANQLQELSQKLESMQQDSEEEETDINIQALREILDNLLKTSFDQEKVMQTLKGTNSTDPNYILNTKKQKDVKDNLKMLEDSLYSLSKKVPQIQSVVNKEIQIINMNVDNALENLAERRTPEANRSQQYAMTSINNLALMLSEALEQMQNAQQNAKSGSKGKKSKSLSQLSKMQEQLNKNMQKARQQMQQDGPQGKTKQGKNAMSQELAKMAREQQMIRQAMQEINRELNKDGRGQLGNLDKLTKEMEQTETDLVNRQIQQETINRQQEILVKLLEAEKAERERDQDTQRQSKQGIDQAPNYKMFLKEYQKIKQRETELLRTVPPSLNSFYKIKVGDYFKFLNSGNNEQ